MTTTTTTTTSEADTRLEDLRTLEAMTWNSFAQDLAYKHMRYGRLSDKQWYWVHKLASEYRAEQAGEKVTPDEGIYSVEGTIYRVKTSKAGNPYAMELLDPQSKDWEYVGRKPFADLTADTKLTVDQAKAHGLQFGWCLICGRELSDPTSVEQGIGPVCIKRIGG